VYAAASLGGRLVAAGQASVADLGASSSTTVALRLIGDPRGAVVQLDAPPTILR
jgi:hypothetical protein